MEYKEKLYVNMLDKVDRIQETYTLMKAIKEIEIRIDPQENRLDW